MSAASAMKAKALEHAGRGRRVFPLVPQGKKPKIPNAHPEGDPLHGICKGECGQQGHGLYDATDDPGVISDWWDRYPNANIGIAIEDDEVLVDADPRHGGSLQQVIDAYELPPTECVQTGSGGHHAIYALPWGSDPSRIRNKLSTGIDIKTVGGYRVAPGSVHESGNSYVAVNATPPAQVNEKLLQALLKPEPKQTPSSSTSSTRTDSDIYRRLALDDLERIRSTPPGGEGTEFKGQQDATYQMACNVFEFVKAGHLDEPWARSRIEEAARSTGLEEHRIQSAIDSAWGKVGPRSLRDRGDFNLGDTTLTDSSGEPIVDKLNEVDENGEPTEAAEAARSDWDNLVRNRAGHIRLEREARRLVDAEERPAIDYPPVRSLREFLSEPDAPTAYRIDEVMPDGARVMLNAQYKAGKSTTTGNLIRSLADGDPFLGKFAVKGRANGIVLIDNELNDNTLRRWLREQRIRNPDAVVDAPTLRGNVAAFNLLDDRCRDAWARRLRDVGCDYLILDCLRPVLDALGLSEDKEVGRFFVAFDALLKDAGCDDALVVQHMGHGGERARGDSRQLDWPDATWRIVRLDDNPASERYFSAFGRDVEVPEGRLGYDAETRHLTLAGGSRMDARKDAAAEAALPVVLDVLAAAKGEQMTQRAVIAASNDKDRDDRIGERKSVPALKLAVERGFITRESGSGNSIRYAVINPCSHCGHHVAQPNWRSHATCGAGTADEQ